MVILFLLFSTSDSTSRSLRKLESFPSAFIHQKNKTYKATETSEIKKKVNTKKIRLLKNFCRELYLFPPPYSSSFCFRNNTWVAKKTILVRQSKQKFAKWRKIKNYRRNAKFSIIFFNLHFYFQKEKNT